MSFDQSDTRGLAFRRLRPAFPDLCYSTIYDVTAPNGDLQRRYIGKDRFYVVLMNVTDPIIGDYVETISAPRSLFFQSELYHRLNQTDNLDAGPILGNAKVVWRDMGEDNEDAITVYLDGDPPVYSLEVSRRRAGIVHGEAAKRR